MLCYKIDLFLVSSFQRLPGHPSQILPLAPLNLLHMPNHIKRILLHQRILLVCRLRLLRFSLVNLPAYVRSWSWRFEYCLLFISQPPGHFTRLDVQRRLGSVINIGFLLWCVM